MRLPFAIDALRFAAPLAALCALALIGGGWPWALPFAVAVLVVLLFFRDPERITSADARAVVSAADGRVAEIDPQWPGNELIPGGVKVGIFLSVLNVHINRAPTDGQVVSLHYTPGKFLNALKAASAVENESNLIRLQRGNATLAVKQIAGTIARRIVCTCRPGQTLARGQRLGLIRFGSRTEHYLPPGTELAVEVGDRVRGGETIIARLPAGVGETTP